MERRPLGRTGLDVPVICLGTMTWGQKNDTAEGFAQMDRALDAGVDFFDTAEMYPTGPTRAETQGATEAIIGEWFAARGTRDRVTLATKIAGHGMEWVRDGRPIAAADVGTAIDGSLKRLRTDRIDLYQVHWPDRRIYHFRRHWQFDPSGQDAATERQRIADVLGALGREVARGRIRAIGLSNDTAWGTMQWLAEARAQGLPRVASVQNEYSLLYRMHDTDMAEISAFEDVGLLAYSPLAAGLLTGKYSGGRVPAGSRASVQPQLGGRMTPRATEAADAYADLAREHGLDPVHMALAFCAKRPFMTSVIIGATGAAQLETALGAADVRLSGEVLEGIDRLHRAHAQPY